MATFKMNATLVASTDRSGDNGPFTELTLQEQIYSPTTGECYSDYHFNALCFKDTAIADIKQAKVGDLLEVEGRIASKTKTLDDGRTFHSCWLKVSSVKISK